MLTPIEIQGKVFKSGIGYDKKDVDQFSKDILMSYEILYKNNVELNDKVSVLSEGLQYYKSIEKTLQKALVLAEKTAEETKKNAIEKADIIEQKAHSNAEMIISDSKNDLNKIHLQTISMVQEYEKYKTMLKQLANTQLELLRSDAFNINIATLEAFEKKTDLHEKEESQVDPLEEITEEITEENTEENIQENQENYITTIQEDYTDVPENEVIIETAITSEEMLDFEISNTTSEPIKQDEEKKTEFEFISYPE